MAFLEIKGMLARLLATENLIVEHDPKAQTAAFNVATRVMKLPVWQTEDEEVYNLFVSHEVGHALWTPQDFPTLLQASKVNSDVANIIEDVRIEKLIQKKFPGLRRDYSLGYRNLYESDLFGALNKPISEFGFLDRINLHYKIGASLLVPFSSEEQKFLNEIDACESYADVVKVSADIQKFIDFKQHEGVTIDDSLSTEGSAQTTGRPLKDSMPSLAKEEKSTQEQQESNSGAGAGGVVDDEEKSEKNSEEDEANSKDESEASVSENNTGAADSIEPEIGDLESETQKALDEAMKIMASLHGSEIVYLNSPTYDPKEFVHPIESVRSSMKPTEVAKLNSMGATTDYSKFMLSSRREVNHMVSQFEMRKSAEAYARIQVNKTGVLNTSELHNYKLSDDIFLRNETLPKGKSHGMVMLLDWSGSMDRIALDTIKQILVLVQFCRKIQIPFRVYTFTTGPAAAKINSGAHKNEPTCEDKIVEVLTSDAKSFQIEKDMFNLFLVGYDKANYRYSGSPVCSNLTMGGTPLITSMFMSSRILEKFKEQTRVDKISFVVVTDGESCPLSYYDSSGNYSSISSYYGYDDDRKRVMIRGKNGSVFPISVDVRKGAGSVAKWIMATQPNVSVSHIFLGNQGVCKTYYDRLLDNSRSFPKDFTKDNGCHFSTETNWPSVALMNPSSFSSESEEIEIKDSAKTNQIRTAFKKFLKNKSGSKKILASIVEDFA